MSSPYGTTRLGIQSVTVVLNAHLVLATGLEGVLGPLAIKRSHVILDGPSRRTEKTRHTEHASWSPLGPKHRHLSSLPFGRRMHP